MLYLSVLVFCTSLGCEELRASDGNVMVFESQETCRRAKQFIHEERKGRLTCQSRPFEFSLTREAALGSEL